jgi:hypothetical protein
MNEYYYGLYNTQRISVRSSSFNFLISVPASEKKATEGSWGDWKREIRALSLVHGFFVVHGATENGAGEDDDDDDNGFLLIH